MAYYVPTLKSMSDLREYSEIDKARAYAIKKMEESKLPMITVFGDRQRNNPVGTIIVVHKMYKLTPIFVWKTASGKSIVFKNGSLGGRL